MIDIDTDLIFSLSITHNNPRFEFPYIILPRQSMPLGWVQITSANVEEKYGNASLAQEIDESVGQ